MLRQAVDNALGQNPQQDPLWIVAGELHAEAVRDVLPNLPEKNLLLEPVGRNTAPAIGYACVHIATQDPQAIVAVLPSDHVIKQPEKLRSALQAAGKIAEQGFIATIGLQVTRPETGFGYIQQGELLGEHQGMPVYRVQRFVEKPDRERATQYMQAKSYLWNGGMFVFRVDVMLEAIRSHMPELAQGLDEIATNLSRDDAQQQNAALYPQLPSQSIDFGVMEKVSQVAVVPVDMGWSDVGSWAALPEVLPADSQGNVVNGAAMLIDSHNLVVDNSGEKLIAMVGCQDLVVVDTADALLVMPRERAQDVRLVLDALAAQGKPDLM